MLIASYLLLISIVGRFAAMHPGDQCVSEVVKLEEKHRGVMKDVHHMNDSEHLSINISDRGGKSQEDSHLEPTTSDAEANQQGCVVPSQSSELHGQSVGTSTNSEVPRSHEISVEIRQAENDSSHHVQAGIERCGCTFAGESHSCGPHVVYDWLKEHKIELASFAVWSVILVSLVELYVNTESKASFIVLFVYTCISLLAIFISQAVRYIPYRNIRMNNPLRVSQT